MIQNGIMIGFGHRRAAREFSTTAIPMTIVPKNEMLEYEEEQELYEAKEESRVVSRPFICSIRKYMMLL